MNPDFDRVLDVLQADYRRFPQAQTYTLYAEDVYFKDPLNEFRGVDRYRKMIGFIETWFIQPQLELHKIERSGNQVKTEWTLSWTTPLPWKPRIHIPGWSELVLNDRGLIISHIDYWKCTRFSVLQQHFSSTLPAEKR